MKLEIPETESYLKASVVTEKGITAVTIVGKGSISKFEDKKNNTTKERFTVPISYANQTDDDPKFWTLNNKSAKALIQIYGEETDDWVGKVAEIIVVDGDYPYIAVDILRTKAYKASHQNKL